MNTAAQPRPIPLHSEWWILPTPEGRRVVAYRPNGRCRAIGPFSTEHTAYEKLDELTRLDAQRRRLVWLYAAGAVLTVVVTVLVIRAAIVG